MSALAYWWTPTSGAIMPPVDHTGTDDVTQALLDFFAQVPNNATVQFVPGGRYRVEGTLFLQNRVGLTLLGNGATIVATTDGSGVTPLPALANKWPRQRSQFHFQNGSDILVRDLLIKGANPNAGLADSAYVSLLEAQHAFVFQGTQRAELDHVTATDVYGDFVMNALGTDIPRNIWVHDSRFERNGRQGMSVVNGEDITFERNYLGLIRRTHFDLEPGSVGDVIRRVTIRNNTFGAGRLGFLSSVGNAGTVEDVTVADNTATGKPFNIQVTAPVGSRRRRIHITNNRSDMLISGSNGQCMRFDRVDDLIVTGTVNPLRQYQNMVGVRATECCVTDVSGNTFQYAVKELDNVSPSC